MKSCFMFLLLISISINAQENKNTLISPFLPEIISEFPNVRDVSISYDENEVYFSVQSYFSELSAIVVIKKENNRWSKPKIVSFSGQFHDIEPFLTPNSLKLYFASNRPLNTSEVKTKDFDIWYVERKTLESEWSEPINLGEPINTSGNEFYPSISSSNNLYFTSDGTVSKGKDDIYFSKFENGKFSSPVSLDSTINTEGYEFNAFVSPDESFLIFTGYNRKDGFGSGDLYISYKDEDENWQMAENMGATINSDKMDYCPFVNLNSNTLYFTSKRNTTKASFQTKMPLDKILNEMYKSENGLSKLYKTTLKKTINNSQK